MKISSSVITGEKPEVSAILLEDNGSIPNSRLPLLIYRHALNVPVQDPSSIEQLFRNNNWGGEWRNGIYNYHHYHSTAHEVLAVFAGSATVRFGGERGVTEKLATGDLVIIPAGVAHRNLGSSADFKVVGAYPEGQRWDMCYGRPGERPKADQNIADVPMPSSDPVYGPGGPLLQHWTNPATSSPVSS
jgi:uncharacterized protein YjlB